MVGIASESVRERAIWGGYPRSTRPGTVGGLGQDGRMLLAELVETSGVVAATRSRKAKVAAIAQRLAQAEVEELPVVTAYVGGTILQRRTGVGWRGLSSLPDAAAEPSV